MSPAIKKVVLALFVTVNFACLALGSYWAYMATLGYEPATLTEAKLRQPASIADKFVGASMVYTMDKFVVNLSGMPKRTIRLQVNLDMIGPESFQEIMDLENRAKARDKIVRVLNEKTFDDLESIQGKLFLKDRIVEEVNKVLDKGLVKDVYFTDFVMN
ncbi:MAG: flagellar basal body-associated FliL family protein [Pseudobdellovibrio sp.]